MAQNGYVYLEVRKGIYGLPQAGLLAYNLLVKRLARHGYEPCQITTGLWKHKTRPITFILTVDDFGVKYVGKHNALHLLNALQQHYEVAVNWEGTQYCGLKIAWDYTNKSVCIAMPAYIPKLLHRLQWPHPKKPQHSPHENVPIIYGQRQQ